MGDIEPEDIPVMLNRAELIGSWKVLNWLARQTDPNMTIEDMVELLSYILTATEEQLAEDYKMERGVFLTMPKIVERRMKGEKP